MAAKSTVQPFKLPIRQLHEAFMAFTKQIMAEPKLQSLNIDWRIPSTTDYDDQPESDRVTVKFVPAIQSVDPHTTVGYSQSSSWVHLEIGLEVTTTHYWLDNANLWQQIEASVYQPDNPQRFQEVMETLRNAHIGEFYTTSLGIPLVPGKTASGAFLLHVAVPS